MKMVTTNIFLWRKKKYTEEIPIGHSSALRQKEFWGRKKRFFFIYIIILCCFCNNWTQTSQQHKKKSYKNILKHQQQQKLCVEDFCCCRGKRSKEIQDFIAIFTLKNVCKKWGKKCLFLYYCYCYILYFFYAVIWNTKTPHIFHHVFYLLKFSSLNFCVTFYYLPKKLWCDVWEQNIYQSWFINNQNSVELIQNVELWNWMFIIIMLIYVAIFS